MEDHNIIHGTRALPHKPGFKAGLCTETGDRETNEDYAAFCWVPDLQARTGAVAAIADGVGGASGGRVAAELAVRSFNSSARANCSVSAAPPSGVLMPSTAGFIRSGDAMRN